MTTTTPPNPSIPSPSSAAATPTSRETVIHNISFAALIVCPLIILLPPRKLDIYTLSLLGGTFLGGNQMSKEWTGISMVQRLQDRALSMTEPALSPKLMETQKRLREQGDRELARQVEEELRKGTDKRMAGTIFGGGKKADTETEVEGEIAKEIERRRKEKIGVVKSIWLGDEGEDWKAKRDERERKALEEGRGYGGLIMDQIWDVWSWGRNKNEEIKEMDEKILRERKEEEEGNGKK